MLQRLPTLLILVIAPPALGAAGLRFEEAIGLAEGSREVQGARRAVEVKRAANAGISRLTANPQITVQPGYRVAQPHEQGIEIQATVSQGFSLAGLGGARRDGARAEADLLAAEARALSLQRRLDAAAAWIETWGAAQVLGEVRREEVVAGELQRLVDRSVALAASTRADGAEARAYVAEARLARLAVEGELWERGLHLARTVAATDGEPRQVEGDLPRPEVPPPSAVGQWLRRLETLPLVQLKLLRARLERLREVEEGAARGWSMNTGVAVQRDQPSGLVLYGLLGLQAPLFDRGERERGTPRALAVRIDGEIDAARAAAATEVGMAFHEVEHSGEVLAEIAERLLPALREAATLRERLYHAGEGTLFEALAARRAALVIAGRWRRAEAAHAWARVHLWLLLATLGDGPRERR